MKKQFLKEHAQNKTVYKYVMQKHRQHGTLQFSLVPIYVYKCMGILLEDYTTKQPRSND